MKFAEVFDLQMGKTPSRDNPSYWNGEYPWVSISDLKGKYISATKEKITTKALESGINKVRKGTVIMSFKLTVGRAAIADCDLYTNEAIMSFVPKPGFDILTDYIYYYLRGHKWMGANKAVMGQTLNKKSISENVFAFPPLPVQEQICSLLDKMNRVIEAKKEQFKELDNLAQAIFYDMFGDPVTNEKGWEIQTMGGFGSFQRGLLLQKKDFVEKGHPCIHYGQLHTSFGSYTTKHLTCISEELFSKSKIAHTGDLVLALTSEDIEGSCKSTAWLGDFDIAVGSDAAIFSHNQNAIYLSFYTRTKAFYNEKEKYARGFKVTHIKTTDIAKIPICLPPISLQQAFAEKVEAIERQKELINQSIREVQTLFDSRMDYWFSEEDDDFGQLDKLD